MKTYLTIIALMLAQNLVFGQDGEGEDEQVMDISETYKCYVYGQCQEYSIDFKVTQDAEGCHKFCGKNDECNWWSWEPVFELCMLFVNCTDNGIDPPAVEPCPDCISGEKMCPARECHGAFKCKGDFVDSFAIATLEGCIEKCGEIEDCAWFTLEKSNDHCILYEECDDKFDCETCATGEAKCANGFKGTTPSAPDSPPLCTGNWVCDVDWLNVNFIDVYVHGAGANGGDMSDCYRFLPQGSEELELCKDMYLDFYNSDYNEGGE